MVESKPRRPDHGVDIQLAVVAERHRRPGGVDRARVEDDATALQGPGAVSDQGVLVLPQALADPRVLRLADQARLVEVPEEVTTEDPLGKRLLGCPDRDVCLPRGERYAVLCSLVTSGPSPSAIGGTKGIWYGPVATTTWSASTERSSSSTR